MLANNSEIENSQNKSHTEMSEFTEYTTLGINFQLRKIHGANNFCFSCFYSKTYEGGSESSVIGVITLLIYMVGCCIIP